MRLLATFAFLLCWISVVASARPLNPVSGQLASEFGCELDYEYYAPSDDKALATVILAHGFMRDLDTVRGWTQHWSSQNIATVIVSFCNSNLINGHHQRNAKDLIALRNHLKLKKVVYAGFSAGGLAAYLAALQDEETIGYLGLDSVDSGDLAINQDQPLKVPALFLLASPSACNAKNNMLDTIVRHDYPQSMIEGATHCHFESPYDKRCGWLCGRSSPEETVAIQADIMAQASRWLLSNAAR
jgi:pimeloyl-ACP methyl ester carboxylesterase